jgi:hypothetical protein
MPPRAKLIALLGLILVPTVAYYTPVVSDLAGAVLAVVFVRVESGLPLRAWACCLRANFGEP